MRVRPTWILPAIAASLAYFLINRFFPQPAHHLRAWRVAALLASAAVYATHIAFEHFERRRGAVLAWHVSGGVAFGAFALALAGMVHSLTATSSIRPSWWLAVFLWPALTAIPAFVAALAIEKPCAASATREIFAAACRCCRARERSSDGSGGADWGRCVKIFGQVPALTSRQC
jgi:MFS family permease